MAHYSGLRNLRVDPSTKQKEPAQQIKHAGQVSGHGSINKRVDGEQADTEYVLEEYFKETKKDRKGGISIRGADVSMGIKYSANKGKDSKATGYSSSSRQNTFKIPLTGQKRKWLPTEYQASKKSRIDNTDSETRKLDEFRT